MEITLRFHGRLTELFEQKERTIQMDVRTAEELRQALDGMDERFRESSYQLAQNNSIIHGKDDLTTQAIDVFPPFSGG
ncbi:MoaD/ThiS family protein [Croceiramulus getboli]|nr:hypothetical protein P8624_09400 [Flavobacteriaceae bacterium YJPT1-3]